MIVYPYSVFFGTLVSEVDQTEMLFRLAPVSVQEYLLKMESHVKLNLHPKSLKRTGPIDKNEYSNCQIWENNTLTFYLIHSHTLYPLYNAYIFKINSAISGTISNIVLYQ